MTRWPLVTLSGRGWPKKRSRSGLGSKRSSWLGAPAMKRKITRFARGPARAFSRAAAICGATGAGLTNLLYAPKGTSVVCFSPRESCRGFFLHLAAVAEQRFTWCLGSFLPEVRASGQFPQLPYEVEEASFQALFEESEQGTP